MAVKYLCTKCDRRFVDWGAEKIKNGEGCDECRGEHLELVGFDAAQAPAKKKPALKRKRVKAVAAPTPIVLSSIEDDDPAAPDLNSIGGEAVETEIEEIETLDDTAIAAKDDDEDAVDVAGKEVGQ